MTLIRLGSVLVIASLAAMLGACGFHLRGTQPVPPALLPLAVECGDAVPQKLCQTLKEQLELGDVRLVSANQADYRLRLSRFSSQRRAAAITPQAAAAEYTLRHSVELELITADQVPLLAPVTVNASETYRYDETNVLAKRREEESLRQQLDSSLAQQILFRLAPLTEERISTLRQQHSEDKDQESSP